MKTQVVFLPGAPPLHHQAERGMQRGGEGRGGDAPGRGNAAAQRAYVSVSWTRAVVLTCHVVHSVRGTFLCFHYGSEEP